jgi:mannose-6-phosphate isomerase
LPASLGAPVLLAPNVLARSYRGGGRVAAWRGIERRGERTPEDWIASTVPARGEVETGLSALPDGRVLRDLLAAAPEQMLGLDHVTASGASPGFFVKLLDGDERLPLHAHPTRAFAGARLKSRYGKTEASVVLQADKDVALHLGFREGVSRDWLLDATQAQDSEALLGAMNAVRLAPGDAVFVPGGVPHCLGAGVLIAEVQEPTDFSILLEWQRFDIDVESTRNGLTLEEAIDGVDRSAWAAERVDALVSRAAPHPRTGVAPLLPPAAEEFFRVDMVVADQGLSLGPAYAVLLFCGGNGHLESAERDLPVTAGDVALVPHAAGTTRLTGNLRAVRFTPGTGAGAGSPDRRSTG